jgi:adenylate cyclase
MATQSTIIFADLTGSTGVFEALGNAKATKVVTKLTKWICEACELHHGRVVKTLGDGVLAVFDDPVSAVEAVVDIQRTHARRLGQWSEAMRMHLKVGMATGEVILVEGDCYGDPVNVASRLSDLSGADQIWALQSTVEGCGSPPPGVRFRNLGPVAIRGKAEASPVFQIDWQEDLQTVQLTVPGALTSMPRFRAHDAGKTLKLTWLDQQASVVQDGDAFHLGRDDTAQFRINDPRVSRLHARIDWRDGNFVLTDMSSYGTWIRFHATSSILPLRRGGCVLVGGGEVALGASFEDFTVPTINFEVTRPA